MSLIGHAIYAMRSMKGSVTFKERFHLRCQFAQDAVWETARQTRNVAAAFAFGALMPPAFCVGHALYQGSPPSYAQGVEVVSSASLITGGLAASVALYYGANTIKNHIIKIYDPDTAVFDAFKHELEQSFKMAVNLLGAALFLMSPYFFGARIVKLIMLGVL